MYSPSERLNPIVSNFLFGNKIRLGKSKSKIKSNKKAQNANPQSIIYIEYITHNSVLCPYGRVLTVQQNFNKINFTKFTKNILKIRQT